MIESPIRDNSFIISGTLINQFKIVYEKASICARRMAILLKEHIRVFCGVELALSDDDNVEETYEILVGLTCRTKVSISKYEYVICITNYKMYIAFQSMFADEYALEYLKEEIFSNNKRQLVNGDIFSCDVSELLKDGQKNAWKKLGDIRVLTANICGSYMCCEERMALLKTVFCEYAPDIIVCQESGPKWRSNEGFLCNILWSAGYREVRIEKILNDNYTPVFYKADHLKLIDSGYHLFSGVNNSNSKSITWAVFNDTLHNQKVGTFSTHFYWTNDEIGRETRIRNAKELSGLMKEIHMMHGCLIVGGGDINCTFFDPPYQILIENGFIDCHASAKRHTNIGTLHDKALFDESLGILNGYDDVDRTGNYAKHVIDFLFTYGEKADVVLHDIIADEESLIGTDHALVYTDISYLK